MSQPALIPMDVPTRRVPFVETYLFEGDWTGSSFLMQVRLVKDTIGTPLFEASDGDGLDLTYAGTDTIANHITAGRLDEVPDGYASGDSLTLSELRVGLSVGKLDAVPVGPPSSETGDDLTVWHDIIRQPPSGDDELIMCGQFIVRAAVTILP